MCTVWVVLSVQTLHFHSGAMLCELWSWQLGQQLLSTVSLYINTSQHHELTTQMLVHTRMCCSCAFLVMFVVAWWACTVIATSYTVLTQRTLFPVQSVHWGTMHCSATNGIWVHEHQQVSLVLLQLQKFSLQILSEAKLVSRCRTGKKAVNAGHYMPQITLA